MRSIGSVPTSMARRHHTDGNLRFDDLAMRVVPAEEGVTAEYETRLREFDNVDSTPIVSMPVESRDLSEDDLKL